MSISDQESVPDLDFLLFAFPRRCSTALDREPRLMFGGSDTQRGSVDRRVSLPWHDFACRFARLASPSQEDKLDCSAASLGLVMVVLDSTAGPAELWQHIRRIEG